MQTNLKTLSRQYANGLLTKTDYRQARAELIDQAQDTDHTQPQVTLPQAELNEEQDQPQPGTEEASAQQKSARPPPKKLEQAASTQEADPSRCKKRNQLLLGLVLLLAAVLGYLLLVA